MGAQHSDALVFFGATGDLAFKKIFPSLQGLIKDEGFDIEKMHDPRVLRISMIPKLCLTKR